jgi:iron complex transport system substrate-binding protein
MEALRIASFLPAATEMVYLLGLGDQLVGVTHECDYPPPAKTKPVLVHCALNLSGMTAKQLDDAVTLRIRSGMSLYEVNEEKLRQAAPNLLITQDLCQVCGPGGNEVSQVLKTLRPVPEILWQTPKSFQEILDAHEELGRKTGRLQAASDWIAAAKEKINRIAAKSAEYQRKTRVAFLEWIDPIYCGGHWIPQMLDWAGAEDRNSKDGTDSVRIPWESVLDYQPEVIIVSPCGFKTDKALGQSMKLTARPGWKHIPAVKQGKVFAVDANAYFARPGPRVVEGVQLLAHLIHPEDFHWSGPADAYRVIPSLYDRP